MLLDVAETLKMVDGITKDFVPEINPYYVPFGHFEDIKKIVMSKIFFPIQVTGLSGNGKTMMGEQVCAQAQHECIRVNVTAETDEDDLIGGFRLVDGNTVWHDGPVIVAMQRGAILLLDEFDLGTVKMMCLQPILEGKGIYLKKIKKFVSPTKGFNVIATSNTKGQGSSDGKFIGTNVQNEAFLERFSMVFEQDYPSREVEVKILENILQKNAMKDEKDSDFIMKLTDWAENIRKTYADGGIDDIISTRRLVHILEAYSIFNRNRVKAIKRCVSRFSDETKSTFIDLYSKIDESFTAEEITQTAPKEKPLKNKNIVFTGTLQAGTRNEVKAKALAMGANFQMSVNKSTHILVCGENPGQDKLDKAETFGTEIMYEDTWNSLCEKFFNPDAGVNKKNIPWQDA